MIYIDPGERRADTMTIVNEHCAMRHTLTGEFKLIAKACGYTELVMRNLAEFFEAGVITTVFAEGEWLPLVWTKTGHYLWQQWRQGPPRRVVEVPAPLERPAAVLPKHVATALLDKGWTVEGVWKAEPLEHLVVSIAHYGDADAAPIRKVMILDASGVLHQSAVPQAEMAMMVPMLLAASL